MFCPDPFGAFSLRGVLYMRMHPGAIAVICALVLTGCSAVPDTRTEELPTETIAVYQALPLPDVFVKIPEQFEKTSSRFYEQSYLCEDASIIITEDKDAAGTSAKDYRTKAMVQYQDMCHTFDLIGNEQLFAGNLSVEMLEFTYAVAEGDPPLTTMVGFTTDGSSVYIITCKCREENYPSYRDQFYSVLESIRVDHT